MLWTTDVTSKIASRAAAFALVRVCLRVAVCASEAVCCLPRASVQVRWCASEAVCVCVQATGDTVDVTCGVNDTVWCLLPI